MISPVLGTVATAVEVVERSTRLVLARSLGTRMDQLHHHHPISGRKPCQLENQVTLQSTRISIRPRTIVRVVPASSRFAQGTAHLQTTHLLLGIQRRKREGEGDHQLHLPLLPPPRAAALVGPQEKHQEIARMVTNWTELEVVEVAVHRNLSTPQPVLPLHQASTNLDLWRTVVDLEVMETLG